MGILTENFVANVGQFDVIAYSSFPLGSFVVTGGQGEVTTPAGTLSAVTVLEIPWTIASASLFTSAVLGSPTWQFPFPGSFCNIGTGIGKDIHNQLFLEVSTNTSGTAIALDILFLFSNSQHNLASVSVPTGQLPDKIGLGLNGNIVTAWLSFAGVWQATAIGSVDVSAIYDFTAPGALTGWMVGVHQDTQGSASATTIAMSQLQYVTPYAPPTTLIAVPNVVNETQASAESDLAAASLLTGTVTTANDPTIVAGNVISSSPAAGTMVSVGSSVDLVISLGPSSFPIPNVVGLSLAVAGSVITANGFDVGSVALATSMTVPIGDIISQSPTAGTLEGLGTPVDLVQSQGPVPLIVPDITNLSKAIAEATIIAAGLTVGVESFAPDVLTIAGNVSSQLPTGGTSASPLESVNLVISTGREGVVVPNLEGLTQAEAITAIVSVGLLVNVISTAPSMIVQSGLVMAQNPTAGTVVASGSFVGFVVSSGAPVVGELFDFEATVISQYANSPTILQLVEDINAYIDQTANFAAFYAFVWNVDTAQGFGLDIWGKIVNVSRLLQIPTTARYVGFQNSSGPPAWDEEPFSAAGTFFTGQNATQSYLLDDESYRRLILTKAFANIVNTTAPAINQILQRLFPGRGNPYVANNGGMSITYTFDFDLTPIELAILQQSTAVPSPVGVSVSISVP